MGVECSKQKEGPGRREIPEASLCEDTARADGGRSLQRDMEEGSRPEADLCRRLYQELFYRGNRETGQQLNKP